jgi:hypothetical protein
LFLGRKGLGFAPVSTVRAITWGRAFDACAGGDFEITKAFPDQAFPADITVCIGFERNFKTGRASRRWVMPHYLVPKS